MSTEQQEIEMVGLIKYTFLVLMKVDRRYLDAAEGGEISSAKAFELSLALHRAFALCIAKVASKSITHVSEILNHFESELDESNVEATVNE